MLELLPLLFYVILALSFDNYLARLAGKWSGMAMGWWCPSSVTNTSTLLWSRFQAFPSFLAVEFVTLLYWRAIEILCLNSIIRATVLWNMEWFFFKVNSQIYLKVSCVPAQIFQLDCKCALSSEILYLTGYSELGIEVCTVLSCCKFCAFSLTEYFLNSANSHQEAVEQTIMALQMDGDSDVKYFASIHPASTKLADDAMSTASSTYWVLNVAIIKRKKKNRNKLSSNASKMVDLEQPLWKEGFLARFNRWMLSKPDSQGF